VAAAAAAADDDDDTVTDVTKRMFFYRQLKRFTGTRKKASVAALLCRVAQALVI